jgi:hypothetical protein
MVAVQELSDRDMGNHSTVAERLIGILSDDVIILMTDEAHFHHLAVSTNRIIAAGQRKVYNSSFDGLVTVRV